MSHRRLIVDSQSAINEKGVINYIPFYYVRLSEMLRNLRTECDKSDSRLMVDPQSAANGKVVIHYIPLHHVHFMSLLMYSEVSYVTSSQRVTKVAVVKLSDPPFHPDYRFQLDENSVKLLGKTQ